MSHVVVRLSKSTDSPALRQIYNHAAQTTTATMDTEGRTAAEQDLWMEAHDGSPYPCLVAETVEDGVVVGYATLSSYIARSGYTRTTETSVYVHGDWHGVGIGGALLSALITEAARRNFVCLIGLVSADNVPSLRLHRRYGFTDVGTLRRVGRKFGQDIDVAILQFLLDEGAGG
ncbi:MAG: N-acetyltransferase [Cytophagales bacterium]|nr:N-acetyltransferase [Armatimonadota bacterium]